MAWAYMKWYVRKIAKPRTKAQMIGAIETFWSQKMTVRLFNR